MSACDGLSTKELSLLKDIPFFDQSTGGFNFDNYDQKFKSLPSNEKQSINRFGDPRISDPMLAYGSNVMPASNPLNIPIITLDKHIDSGDGTIVPEKIWIKDGDSPGGIQGATRYDEGRLRKVDAFETAKAYEDVSKPVGDSYDYHYETGHHGDPKYLVIRQSDPYANIQSRITEKILLNAQEQRDASGTGYPKIIPSEVGYDNIGPRPVQSYKIDYGDDNPIDLEALQVKTGAVLMHHVNWNNPELDPSITQDKMRQLQSCAASKGFGVHSQDVSTKVDAFERAKKNIGDLLYNHLSPLKSQFNSKKEENKSLNAKFSSDPGDMVKIGDVWLEIPPTHLLISQLRSSQNVPLLGVESRPQMTPITNRTVLKLNVIFQGEKSINNNLSRIIQQFKYVPINLIRSRDIFHKLSKENKWLTTVYGGDNSNDLKYTQITVDKDGNRIYKIDPNEALSGYCIPVTMDSYTLYSIEGHPDCIGCSIEMSLFNPMPYFHNNYNEKIQYIRYNENLHDFTKMGDTVKVKDVVRFKSEKNIEKVFEPTLNLEESVHPYNFLIEHERKANSYHVNPSAPSEVIIYKVDNPFSDKHWEMMIQSSGKSFSEKDCIQLIQNSQVKQDAHSISLSYQNNFAWVPVLEHAVPTAQYIGPGETQVSINIKTTNDEAVRQLLRSYKESVSPDRYGNFENRFLVQSPMLDLAGANILTIQNLVVSSVEGKPGLSDINLVFSKTIFESISRADNEPVKGDDYWGLKRITRLLDEPFYQEISARAEKLQKKDNILFKIKNAADVDINGLFARFSSDLNHTLENISKMNVNTPTLRKGVFSNYNSKGTGQVKGGGQEIINKLQWKQAKLSNSVSNSAIDGAFVNKVIDNFNNLQQKYTAKYGDSLNNSDKEHLTVQMATELEALSISSKSDKDRYKAVMDNFNTYYMMANGYCAIFDIVGATKDEIEFLKKNLTSNGFKVGVNKTRISISKMPSEAKTVQNARELGSTAVLEQVVTQKESDRIKSDIESGLLIDRPHAAHRWFNRIDSFVSYNKLFSKTMGYWYAQNRLKNMSSEISALKTEMGYVGDYMTDTDAYKIPYMKQTWHGLEEEMGNREYSCLNVGRTLAMPSLKKDTTSLVADSRNPLNDKDGKRQGLFFAQLKGNKEPITKDFALNKFSTCLFNENHFRGDPAINQYMRQFFSNNIRANKTPYDQSDVYDTNYGAKISDVYDTNGKLMGVVGNDGQLHKMSDVSMKDIYPALSSMKVTDKPEDFAKKLIKSQIFAKTTASTPGSASAESYSEVNKTPASAPTTPKSVTVSNPDIEWYKAKQKEIIKKMANAKTDAEYKKWNQELINYRKNNFGQTVQATVKAKAEATAKAMGLGVPQAINLDDGTQNYLIQQVYNSEMTTVGLQNAYPTYKIYIIHDNLGDYKYKSLDYYWDYRLLQDLMVVRDRNNPAHILKCRLVVDPRKTTTSAAYDSRYGFSKINEVTGQPQNIIETRSQNDESKNGTEDMFSFIGGRSPLRQGMRICIKLGYHTDPRYLDTVFIGTITQLSAAGLGMYELEARGDGRELVVPSSIQNSSLSGYNFSDLISQMLRSNPNIIHFGRMFGSHIEQFSRRNKNLMNFIMSRFSVSGLLGASTAALGFGGVAAGAVGLGVLGGSPLVAGMVVGGVGGILYNNFSTGGDYGHKLLEAAYSNFLLNSSKGAEKASTSFSNLFSRFSGDLYNADKATTQLFRHMSDILENGHNPVDNNIFAYDIWASGCGSNVNLKANNQRTVWDILRDIQRVYPGYALDVRPYGSRSTLFLGDPDFHYMRTDDPLLAMAPSFIERSDATRASGDNNDKYRKAIMEYSPKRELLGNIDPATLSSGMLPMIPFQKHHIATSWDNIISNNVRATPERGWNSVVISKSADGSGTPEEYVANADIFNYALRRKFAVVDWTNDARLSQYYALGLLKEGVERLYGGTLILTGNAKIEPYDKIYICDKVNQMYGWVQVETVIHKFDSEMGFTTHIVPNMVCKINDTAYHTTGDLRWKFFRNRISDYWNSRGAAGVGVDAISLLVGALPMVGPWAALGINIALNTALEVNKHFQKSQENETFINSQNGLPSDTLAAMNSYNWIENIVDWKYGVLGDTAAYYAGKGLRSGATKRGLVAAGKGTVRAGSYLVGDVFAGAVRTIYGKIRKDKTFGGYFASLMPDNVPNFIKKWGQSTVSFSKELKAAALDAAKTYETINLSKQAQAIEKVFGQKKLRSGELKGQFSKLSDAERLILASDNIHTAEEFEAALTKINKFGIAGKGLAGAKVVGKTILGKVKAVANSGLGRNVSMLLALQAIMELPTLVEMFAIESATKGNIVCISPLWFKDSMLMPGLEGYRNNDTWMHMKGMVMNAKDAFSEAKNSLNDYEPVKLAGDITMPDMNFDGNAFAAVPSGNFKPQKASITEQIADKSSGFNIYKPMVLDALKRVNRSGKYILQPEVVYGLIQRESEWNPSAVGHKDPNDRGIMQINGVAHPTMDGRHGLNPFDPKTNIDYGVNYLFGLLQTYKGNIPKAVSAYNAGRATTANSEHTNAVMSFYSQYKKAGI